MPFDSGEEDYGGGECPDCGGSGLVYRPIPLIRAITTNAPWEGAIFEASPCRQCDPSSKACRSCAGWGQRSVQWVLICDGEVAARSFGSVRCTDCDDEGRAK